MANINKIRLSGTTYSIQDLNATKTVELTQAEYDALSPKDPNVFYIITDAKAGDLSNYYTKTETDGLLDTKLDVTAYTPTDLSNYYTKSETSGATEISTALSSKADTATTYTKTETDNAITAATSTKQDTLVSGTNIKTINSQSILGEGNIEIQGGSGGGKAIEAGRGISITTGETADTVSFNLPISAITGTNIMYGGANNSVSITGGSSNYNNFFGSGNTISVSGLSKTSAICNIVLGNENSVNFKGSEESWQYSLIIGRGNSVSYSTYMGKPSPYNIICGANNTIDKNISNCFVMGSYNKPKKKFNTNIGNSLNTTNDYEFAHATFNVSSSATTSFGDSGNTLFSVGNGSSNSARHNAFEIMQNGDIYIADTNDTSTTNYYEKPMIKLQDALGGGGGSSYTAGDGIDISNDVISVTGKVDTTTYETYTAATDTALASKQTTLTAGTGISIVDNVISATSGGGGGESCTVDSTTMFYTFNHRYSNDALDMRVRYAVLDYGQDRTEIPNVSIDVNFRDANYNTYVNQNINLDYSTSSYTLGDISQAEYIDVTYDSTIEDFKIAVATAYTSTVFVGAINFWTGNIKIPFYTISSGSPCTAIENDIPTAISELGNNMLKGLRQINISSQKNAIYTYYETIGGNGEQRKLKLDEIDGSDSTLKPDIYIGLGRSGWTEINLSEQCNIGSLKATKYRVTYNDSELDTYSMGLQLTVEYAGNEMNDSVVFDETKHPSLQTQDVFSAATLDWNASTKELVITYPETIELYGKQESVNISQIYSNGCNFGNAITKLESYGEAKQALKPYVKETRAALGGKLDTSAITTSISSSSTDAQVPSAKAVYDQFGGLKLVKLTQSEYDSLTTKDNSSLYVIVN